jgi:acyl-CoA synthetase (AMP-forming)/AMP-acid ligase II
VSAPLRLLAAGAAAPQSAVFATASAKLTAKEVFGRCHLGGDPALIGNRSVVVATRSQASAALALLSLDGVARRLVLVPPGLGTAALEQVMARAEAEVVVCERESWQPLFSSWPCLTVDPQGCAEAAAPQGGLATEWVLLTSGTTGVPKLVVHRLATLTGAMASRAASPPAIWGTFYDIRRYGGLQAFLRAILGGGPLVLPDPEETPEEFLTRASELGLDYLSGTPSHWRRALMGRALAGLRPRCVRLSGEIADQVLLDRVRERFDKARIVHAFASTEAGVAFEVTDGHEGFPANVLENTGTPVELKVKDGTLRIRSPRTALRILGTDEPVADPDGFVDTRDIVERRGARCYFAGRRDGIINSGGNKVHPEEIEALLNGHPRVEMSRARARKNPILGAIIEADVVLRSADGAPPQSPLEEELLRFCAATLPVYKRPTKIRVVPSLSVSAAGKLERQGA